jgi:hypothetical protein
MTRSDPSPTPPLPWPDEAGAPPPSSTEFIPKSLAKELGKRHAQVSPRHPTCNPEEKPPGHVLALRRRGVFWSAWRRLAPALERRSRHVRLRNRSRRCCLQVKAEWKKRVDDVATEAELSQLLRKVRPETWQYPHSMDYY